MATTTAQITLTSTDISDNSISMSNTATLTKAGTATGLELCTGLRRRTFSGSTTIKDLVNLYKHDDEITASKAAKVYIKNVDTDSTKYVRIGIGDITDAAGAFADNDLNDAEEIGRLYAGDWMFFPYDATLTGGSNHANNADVFIQPTHTNSLTVEYMVFFE